jgi:hypothetical protein
MRATSKKATHQHIYWPEAAYGGADQYVTQVIRVDTLRARTIEEPTAGYMPLPCHL